MKSYIFNTVLFSFLTTANLVQSFTIFESIQWKKHKQKHTEENSWNKSPPHEVSCSDKKLLWACICGFVESNLNSPDLPYNSS